MFLAIIINISLIIYFFLIYLFKPVVITLYVSELFLISSYVSYV